MRIRQIKPGIMSNEDIAELGPYAYILFTGLWMIADREGRLENRPRRIKALVMPLWDAVSSKDVENLLEKLCGNGMLHAYEMDGKAYIAISNWCDHQRPDPRESQSQIPPPPPKESARHVVNGRASTTCEKTMELQCVDTVIPLSKRVGSWNLELGTGIVVEQTHTTCGSPPEENPTTTKTKAPKPKPKPAAEVPRRPVARAASATPAPAHKAADFALIRESLNQLAIETRMPPPDDDLIRKVLDSAGGASGDEVHGVLVALYKRNKFRAMYSWGFVPLVIEQAFRAA